MTDGVLGPGTFTERDFDSESHRGDRNKERSLSRVYATTLDLTGL